MVPSVPIYKTEMIEIKDKINDRLVKINILPNVVTARYMKIHFIGM